MVLNIILNDVPVYLISCSRGRVRGAAWEDLEMGTGQPQGWGRAGTGRKMGPRWEVHVQGVKGPAWNTQGLAGNVTQVPSPPAPQPSSDVSPPPDEKLQSTGVTSYSFPCNSPPSLQSLQQNKPTLEPFPTQQDPPNAQHRPLLSRTGSSTGLKAVGSARGAGHCCPRAPCHRKARTQMSHIPFIPLLGHSSSTFL